MSAIPSLVERIHTQALEASARYQKAEADLIEVLQAVEAHRVFLVRGHSSLFSYAIRELRLPENAAYNLITVARKAREVPALQEKIRSGEIHLTNARRVAALASEYLDRHDPVEKAKRYIIRSESVGELGARRETLTKSDRAQIRYVSTRRRP